MHYNQRIYSFTINWNCWFMPGKALSLSFCFFFLSALSYHAGCAQLPVVLLAEPLLVLSLAISLCLHSSTSLPHRL